jgi:Ca2+/H+ antiporter
VSILAVLLLLTGLSIAAVAVGAQQRQWRYRGAFCHVFALLSAVLISFPLSIAATFTATPFWKWLGSLLGVQLAGRAGPPVICYFGVFVLFTGLLGTLGVLLVRRALAGSRHA